MNIQQIESKGNAAFTLGVTKLNQEVLTSESKAELLAAANLTKKLVTTAYLLTFGSLTTAARFSYDTGAEFRSTLQSTLEDLLVQLELITIYPISVEELRVVVESVELEDLVNASSEESKFVMDVLNPTEPEETREVAMKFMLEAMGEYDNEDTLMEINVKELAEELNNLPAVAPSEPEEELNVNLFCDRTEPNFTPRPKRKAKKNG